MKTIDFLARPAMLLLYTCLIWGFVLYQVMLAIPAVH